MINWPVELSEFDISYHSRPAIKGQALADFIVECTMPDKEPEMVDTEGTSVDIPTTPPVEGGPDEEYWRTFFDGASNKSRNGAGVVLYTPDDFKVEYAMTLNFDTTNNEAEYEAMLAVLTLARRLRAKRIRVHINSQLVVNHVSGDYTAREPRMAKCLAAARNLLGQFERSWVVHGSREENADTNLLSKLASGDLEEFNRPVYSKVLDSA
ncbi:uncharacterized protein [Rutidosis leptorrhynchoides]|uniref:uncharacterized protein n=1 Tax=Rutidosis leptorrhynchoides TaxID=125765 RepID=UPI003A9A1BD0